MGLYSHCPNENKRHKRKERMSQSESDYRLAMVYHENGGNESFEVRGGHMSTLKSFSDPNMSHNFMVFVPSFKKEPGAND